MQLRASVFIIALAVTTASCSRTNVVSTWKRPNYEPSPAEKTLVVGIAERSEVREAFEAEVVRALSERSHPAEPGGVVLPPNAARMRRSELKAKVQAMGFDGALVMALVDRVDVPKNPPGGYSAQTFGSLYTNYPTWFGEVEGTVPDDTTTVYVLEARYYDLDETGVVWRTQTETKQPKDIASFAREFAKRIVRRMVKDQIITE